MSVVIDASIALTWCCFDERTPATIPVLKPLSRSRFDPLEDLNALVVAQRRRRCGAARIVGVSGLGVAK